MNNGFNFYAEKSIKILLKLKDIFDIISGSYTTKNKKLFRYYDKSYRYLTSISTTRSLLNIKIENLEREFLMAA